MLFLISALWVFAACCPPDPADCLLVKEEFDVGATGDTDIRTTYDRHDDEGHWAEKTTQGPGDEESVVYRTWEEGLLVSQETDTSDNGVINAVLTWDYDDEGRLVQWDDYLGDMDQAYWCRSYTWSQDGDALVREYEADQGCDGSPDNWGYVRYEPACVVSFPEEDLDYDGLPDTMMPAYLEDHNLDSFAGARTWLYDESCYLVEYYREVDEDRRESSHNYYEYDEDGRRVTMRRVQLIPEHVVHVWSYEWDRCGRLETLDEDNLDDGVVDLRITNTYECN